MRFQSVTFDLDGTLLDTLPDLAEASNRMLAELRLPLRGEDEIRSFVGRGIVVLVRRSLDRGAVPDEALVAHAVEVFKRHYAAVNGNETRVFAGVLSGLEAWRATGVPLAVLTNKPAAFTEPLLERMGLKHYFSVIVSGDSTPFRKPHPEPLRHACTQMGRAVNTNLHIGDSRHDIEAARAAGCAVYCVPYGYNEGEAVSASDCDALVDNLELALLMAMRGKAA